MKNATNTKLKPKRSSTEKNKKVAKKRSFPSPAKKPRSQKEIELSELESAWTSEVNELVLLSFPDFDSALNAVVERVVARMETPLELRQQTADFLRDIFEGDPVLKQELCDLLVAPRGKSK